MSARNSRHEDWKTPQYDSRRHYDEWKTPHQPRKNTSVHDRADRPVPEQFNDGLNDSARKTASHYWKTPQRSQGDIPNSTLRAPSSSYSTPADDRLRPRIYNTETQFSQSHPMEDEYSDNFNRLAADDSRSVPGPFSSREHIGRHNQGTRTIPPSVVALENNHHNLNNSRNCAVGPVPEGPSLSSTSLSTSTSSGTTTAATPRSSDKTTSLSALVHDWERSEYAQKAALAIQALKISLQTDRGNPNSRSIQKELEIKQYSLNSEEVRTHYRMLTTRNIIQQFDAEKAAMQGMQDKFLKIEAGSGLHEQALKELKAFIHLKATETGFHTASLKKISDEIKKNQVLLEKLLEQHCDTIIIPTSGVDSSKFKALRKEWVQVVIRILDQFDNLSKQMAVSVLQNRMNCTKSIL